MNIVIDENIDFAKAAFEKYGNVILISGREITNNLLKNADALIVRSVTKVDKYLLHGTPVKFVGTATIGTDHIDIDYLKENSIFYASAPGCNSYAVAEYVISAFAQIAAANKLYEKIKTVGIIGYGNIGSKVAKHFESLGYILKINDPPLEKTGKENISFCSIDESLECDIITLHVPYTKTGDFPTHHLIDSSELERIKENSLLINTSRGSVINNESLKIFLNKKKVFTVLDVWENEPNPSAELVALCDISTPHIAGYSLEGKINGTVMIERAFSDFLKVNTNWEPNVPPVRRNNIVIKNAYSREELLFQISKQIYDIENDSIHLKNSIKKNPDCFDILRKTYTPRREFSNYKITMNDTINDYSNLLESLRVKIV